MIVGYSGQIVRGFVSSAVTSAVQAIPKLYESKTGNASLTVNHRSYEIENEPEVRSTKSVTRS